VRFYQRLLARDEDEAATLVERKAAELGPVGVMDHVLIPTLALLIQHRTQEEITNEDAEFVMDVVSETVQQISPIKERSLPTPRVVGLAARTPVDHLVLDMLAGALTTECMEIVPDNLSPDRAIRCVLEKPPKLVCITAISPTRGSEIRNYCRRLRQQAPDTKVLVFRPTIAEADLSRSVERIKESGAHSVATTMQEAIEAVNSLLGVPAVEGTAEKVEEVPLGKVAMT
jgi:hypothetical protein